MNESVVFSSSPPVSPPLLLSACDELTAFLSSVESGTRDGSANALTIGVPSTLLVASLLFSLAGSRMYKIVVVAASLSVSGWAGYVATEGAESLSCAARLSIGGGSSLAGGLLSLLLLRWSLFLLGSISFGLTVHLLFVSVPALNSVGNMPSLFGYSLLYWVCLVVAIIGGGVFVHFRKREAIVVCTSMIGGAGVGFSSALLATASSASIPAWAFFLLGSIVFLGGCLFQVWWKTRRERRRRRREHSSRRRRREREVVLAEMEDDEGGEGRRV